MSPTGNFGVNFAVDFPIAADMRETGIAAKQLAALHIGHTTTRTAIDAKHAFVKTTKHCSPLP